MYVCMYVSNYLSIYRARWPSAGCHQLLKLKQNIFLVFSSVSFTLHRQLFCIETGVSTLVDKFNVLLIDIRPGTIRTECDLQLFKLFLPETNAACFLVLFLGGPGGVGFFPLQLRGVF